MAPESTAAAIRAAARAGAQMVEVDVQMTRDGRLVVFHDDRLERTTTGAGRLSHMRYAQLAKLDAGAWFHPRFLGERILLLSQALRLVPRPMRINLEIKATPNPQVLIDRLLAVVGRAGAGRRLIVSSFDAGVLRRLTRTRLALALLCRVHPDRSLQQAVREGCVAWHPFHRLVSPRRIARAHAAGLRVHAWTVDEPRRARQLMRWGVDGIFTNDPARLRQAVR